MARIKPPFKYYGGKFYLCKWIESFFPEHETYVEPFGGAGSVLLNKQPAQLEIYNDLNEDIVLLMRQIKDNLEFFTQKLREIPCEEEIYYSWKEKECDNPFDRAVRAFVIYRMSRGGTATTFSKSKREYRGLPENVAAWETSINNLPKVSDRLRHVIIENKDAIAILKKHDSPETLFYLDPPYVSSSRKNSSVYTLEMDNSDHEKLLDFCLESQSKIIISGYGSELYDEKLTGWKKHDRSTFLHGGHRKKKILVDEILWSNFYPAQNS